MRLRLRQVFVALIVGLFGVLFAGLSVEYTERTTLPSLAQGYLKMVPDELGSANTITGILLVLRGFDTLGEVAVLFMVAAGVGLVLRSRREAASDEGLPPPEPPTPSTELVKTGAEILLPLISIFAVYVIMNGHLSAGGGFQGGAVIASAVLLILLAFPESNIDLNILSITESIVGVAFVLVGIAGLLFAGGFLDSRILPLGQFGAFFSAGSIPIVSVLLGVKVGCELCVIVDRFRG